MRLRLTVRCRILMCEASFHLAAESSWASNAWSAGRSVAEQLRQRDVSLDASAALVGAAAPRDLGVLAAGGHRAVAVQAAWARLRRVSARAKNVVALHAALPVHPTVSAWRFAHAISHGAQATGVAERYVRAARVQAC